MAVDAFSLGVAANRLQSMNFPAPPPPVSMMGTDSAAAAIKSILPTIEAPVIEGLPAAQVALAQTGSKIASAAAIYAEADHLLGETFGQLGATVTQVGGIAAERLQMASRLGLATLPLMAVQQVVPLAQGLAQSAPRATGHVSDANLMSTQSATDTRPGEPPAVLVDNADRCDIDPQHQPDTESESPEVLAGYPTLESTPAQDGNGAARSQDQEIPSTLTGSSVPVQVATTPEPPVSVTGVG